jgi:site-specific DNA-methyltransferase (adenine-specific)
LRGQAALELDEHRFDVKPWLKDGASIEPVYTSALGALFAADCMEVLPQINSGVVDMVFADPPFNLGKEYGENCNYLRPDENCLN